MKPLTASRTESAEERTGAPNDSLSPLVQVKGLGKTFRHMGNQLQVLKGIDLSLQRGEIMSIVGASGAGKSTLLHCIGTLDLPTSGSILFDGVELTRLSGSRLARLRNRSIGFVFQFHHLLPEFNALENIMMPGLIRGDSRKSLVDRASTLLSEVGLSHRATHRPGELSGGEQQRVAIARALSLEPKLLLADEPTGNLDSKTSDAIHNLFLALNENRATTVVVVTHNPNFAARMPRVVEMRDGHIVGDGPGSAYGQAE